MRGTVGRTWVTQLCDTLEWPSCAHTWVTQLCAHLRGIKRLHKHNRNKYLGNISITGLKRIKNDTENVSSGLKTWLFQSNLMYFLMWKGEFPPILLGFELALHRHYKTIPQGIKWCWWIFQVIYCPWKIALANAVLGDCPVPCQPQLPWHGVTQSLRLVPGCPEQGIPKVSGNSALYEPTGTLPLQCSVSSRLSFNMRMKCCVPGNRFSKPVYVFINLSYSDH